MTADIVSTIECEFVLDEVVPSLSHVSQKILNIFHMHNKANLRESVELYHTFCF